MDPQPCYYLIFLLSPLKILIFLVYKNRTCQFDHICDKAYNYVAAQGHETQLECNILNTVYTCIRTYTFPTTGRMGRYLLMPSTEAGNCHKRNALITCPSHLLLRYLMLLLLTRQDKLISGIAGFSLIENLFAGIPKNGHQHVHEGNLCWIQCGEDLGWNQQPVVSCNTVSSTMCVERGGGESEQVQNKSVFVD